MSVTEEFQKLEAHASNLIIGQAHLINRMLIALLCDGHLLVEGAPGLAKTRAIKVLAESIEGNFHRLQFTPDLLPADLTGTDIYRPQDGTFQFREGPLFHNLILADEINRAPAKVQSALLEAMASGLPAVCANATGSNSLVLDGETGFLAPPKNPEAFAAHVRKLILDKDLRNRQSNAAFEASSSYSWPNILSRVMTYYDEVLGNPVSTNGLASSEVGLPAVRSQQPVSLSY